MFLTFSIRFSPSMSSGETRKKKHVRDGARRPGDVCYARTGAERRSTRSRGPRYYTDRSEAETLEPSSPGLDSKNEKSISFTDMLFRSIKRETGLEPAALSLGRRCSTTEPLAHYLCTR